MPLVPVLYHQLMVKFGSVSIANEGESLVETFKQPLLHSRSTDRKPFPDIVHPGEYYRVVCPLCQKDDKKKLWINHRLLDYSWLMVCYRCNGFSTTDARKKFIRDLFDNSLPSFVEVHQGEIIDSVNRPTLLPDGSVPMRNLPLSHHAHEYLTFDRHFDSMSLALNYGLHYCHTSRLHPAASDRIIIPFTEQGTLIGWQGRFVGERLWSHSSTDKYYNLPGFRKKATLYNLDIAASMPWVALVEGVTDAWAVGPMAMALCGKTISFTQTRILCTEPFSSKPVFVMLDGAAQDENDRVFYELLTNRRAPVIKITLPSKVDPGSLSAEVNLDLIKHAARDSGLATVL